MSSLHIFMQESSPCNIAYDSETSDHLNAPGVAYAYFKQIRQFACKNDNRFAKNSLSQRA
jgi:hypothetical protein